LTVIKWKSKHDIFDRFIQRYRNHFKHWVKINMKIDSIWSKVTGLLHNCILFSLHCSTVTFDLSHLWIWNCWISSCPHFFPTFVIFANHFFTLVDTDQCKTVNRNSFVFWTHSGENIDSIKMHITLCTSTVSH